MPKTGLKTFVYSFSLSLFSIFCINGYYWHNRPSVSQSLKISDKNIMLFLRGDQLNPSVKPVPVRKIALSVLPEIKKETEALRANLALTPTATEPEIIMADTFDTIEIPLDISPFIEEEYSEPPLKLAEKLPTDEVTTPQPQVAEISNLKKGIRRTKKIAEDAPPEPNNPQLRLKKSEQFIAQSVAPVQKPGPSRHESGPLLALADSEPKDLFPLQKGRDELAGNGQNINVKKRVESHQVALADAKIPIQSMEAGPHKSEDEPSVPAEDGWQPMSERKAAVESPWVVAKGAVKSGNALMQKEAFYQEDRQAVQEALGNKTEATKGVKVASETVKNLLIPIPEDILNDKNLVPQLVSSGKPDELRREKEISDEVLAEERSSVKSGDRVVTEAPRQLLVKKAEPAPELDMIPQKNEDNPKKNTILNSLSSIFSSDTKVKEASSEDGFLSSARKKLRGAKRRGKIMPTEMRLSFQPNRAEISGQTLRWIQAFASKAAEDNFSAIEIRIDGTSSTELQQKRLNLLHNILTNKGVVYSKINTVFTQREPNSFIIRTVKLNNTNTGSIKGKQINPGEVQHLQW